jgi:hypothetical protein
MKTTKRWLRVVMSGLLLTGCGGPLEPGEGLEGAAGNSAAYVTAIPGTAAPGTTTNTPPAVVEITTAMDMQALWPSTTSVRRFVVLVAYTMPMNSAGYRPPPRFRAFGVDAASRTFHFQVDGDRGTFLKPFMEAMFAKDATIVSTPPGMKFDTPTISPVILFGADGQVTASATTDGQVRQSNNDNGFATEPVVRSSGSTGTGGHDPWILTWTRLADVASHASNAFTSGNFEAIGAYEAR